MVERRRIMRALDLSAEAELTLVAAPPGYGKTTATRAWCASRASALAWVTLDAGDNDPSRFWSYVATAVDRVRRGLGRGALRRLSEPGPTSLTSVDELMNGIAAFGEELVLVLDDVQTVTSSECLASIDYGLERLPANARLIMLTRVDPPLRLAELRAHGALAELRADELAFTREEAHELVVERSGVELEPEEVELLWQRTEGWPAALFLAAFWLRRVDDPRVAAREFGGDHRFVADYLSREVIAALDEDARSVLLRASVLGRLTAELCDAVLDRSDSAAVLGELERSNLFVVHLEHPDWYRVHSLFAEFARSELAAVQPHAARQIHLRAAVWLRSRGLPVEAVEHAAAAGDHDLVADLLSEHHLAMIRTGGARTLIRWMSTLPDAQLVRHPVLTAAAATAVTMAGQMTLDRRRLVALIGRAERECPERVTSYVQAVVAMVSAATMDGGVTVAVRDGRRAVALASVAADDVIVAARAGCACALYFAGDLDEAWEVALRAIEHPNAEHRAPGQALARSALALVAVERGWLASGRSHAEKAKSLVASVAASRSWLGASAAAALGTVLEQEGNLVDAEREVAYAEHFLRDEVATVHHAWVLIVLARVRCGRGRVDEAVVALRAAQQALGELADSGQLPSLAAEVERELEQAVARAGGGELLEMPSQAELAVLRLLASDLSAREIGDKLFLSANTVRSHTRSIYRKLGVNSRAEAVARGETLGLRGKAQSPSS
jgi:LuxR family maltose regulon positive regulatory protein